MKKINNLLFPQSGKETIFIRLYIVLLYLCLVAGIIFTLYYYFNEIKVKNTLKPEDVQTQLGWSLMMSSITPYTLQQFSGSNVYNLDKDLSNFNNGYEYLYYLEYTEIPKLANRVYIETNSEQKRENILLVIEVLDKGIEDNRALVRDLVNIRTVMDDILLTILFIVFPIFIIFRAVMYRIIIYIMFGKNNNNTLAN